MASQEPMALVASCTDSVPVVIEQHHNVPLGYLCVELRQPKHERTASDAAHARHSMQGSQGKRQVKYLQSAEKPSERESR